MKYVQIRKNTYNFILSVIFFLDAVNTNHNRIVCSTTLYYISAAICRINALIFLNLLNFLKVKLMCFFFLYSYCRESHEQILSNFI